MKVDGIEDKISSFKGAIRNVNVYRFTVEKFLEAERNELETFKSICK